MDNQDLKIPTGQLAHDLAMVLLTKNVIEEKAIKDTSCGEIYNRYLELTDMFTQAIDEKLDAQ